MNDLPAYGFLSSDDTDDLENRPALYVPLDWDGNEQGHDRPDRASWESWKTEMVAMLDDLWPAFARDTEQNRADRRRQRLALTRRDLDLMHARLQCLDWRATSAEAIDERQHWDLYLKEDALDGELGDTLPYYAPRLAAKLQGTFATSIATGYARKLGTALLQFKKQFARPRAYQTAMLVAPDRAFVHRFAATGCTPSFVSGHCLQAILGVAYLYERLVVSGIGLEPSTVHALEQYAADIGDRRVYAGVHYPSDSLGSWLVAIALAPRVFPKASATVATTFVGNAIRRSYVYRTLHDDAGDVYRVTMRRLDAYLANGKAGRTPKRPARDASPP